MLKVSKKIKDIFSILMPYIIILFATIYISIPLLNKDLDMFRDDGIQHICRLMGTYQSIKEGQVFPVIMSNFCNGFGYSWNLFYSPLTAFVPLIFKILDMSFTNCIKIFMFIVVYLSGVAMYTFINKVTKNKNIAILASIFYIFAPYRLTDMYLRNALAELASFIFIPMIFNGLYTILDENKKSHLLAIGIIGLILTHLIVTMYMAIICFVYVIVDIKKLKNSKVLKNLIFDIVFALIVTSFFWVPLLQNKCATQYEVFVPGRMERVDVLEYYKINPIELLVTSKEQSMIYAIGLVIVIGLVLTPLTYKKLKGEYKKLYLTFLSLGIILTIMTLSIFPFEKLPDILTMIQFTFRLLEFTACMFAAVAAINYGLLIKNFNINDVVVLTIITGLLLIPYTNKIDYKNNNENVLWPAVKLTSNTGRVHAGMASFEYLPSKAFENKEYIIERTNGPVIINGETTINSFNKNGSNMDMILTDVKSDTTIELPYIYYLGYNITLENGNSQKNKINYTESDKGFIEINIPQSDSAIKVTVKYTGTKAMQICSLISIISILIYLSIQIIKNHKTKYKKA